MLEGFSIDVDSNPAFSPSGTGIVSTQKLNPIVPFLSLSKETKKPLHGGKVKDRFIDLSTLTQSKIRLRLCQRLVLVRKALHSWSWGILWQIRFPPWIYLRVTKVNEALLVRDVVEAWRLPFVVFVTAARDLWAKLVKPDALNRFFTSSFDDLLKENIHIKSHPASITVDWSMRLLYSKAFEFPASGLLSAKEILVKMRKTHLSPLSSQFHSIDALFGCPFADGKQRGNTGNFKNGWKREINDDPINEMEERRNNKRKKLSHQNQTIEELAEIKDFRLNMPARRSQKLSDKITTLQKLVSPYGKTDTASVLQEASLYIKLLQEQIQMLSSSYRSLRAIHPQHCPIVIV
ncbi:hypothetical protein V6N13_137204 [Hibiscus sabdariffa]